MPYWKYNGEINNTPGIWGYVQGEELEFDLVFVNDTTSDILGAYVFTDIEFVGLFAIRKADEVDFLDVHGPFDAFAYLGHLPVGETSLRVRYKNDAASLYTTMEAFLSIPPRITTSTILPATYAWDHFFSSGPWAPCYQQQQLWRTDYLQIEPACLSLSGDGGPWSADWNPGQFEDSYDFPQWRDTY